MKRRRVTFDPDADADLERIAFWIAEQGVPATALRFVRRIRDRVLGYAYFPERGRLVGPDLPDVRIIVVTANVVAAFKVYGDHVAILRIFYGGQDWEGALRGGDGHREDDE